MRYLLLLSVIVTLSSTAFGHQGGGDSYLHLTVDEDVIDAELGVSLRTLSQITDFDDNGDYKVTEDEMRRHLDAIADYALSRLTLSVGDTPCDVHQAKHEAVGRFAIIRFVGSCPAPLRSLTINYNLFFDVDPLHRGLLRLEHEDRTHTAIFTHSQDTRNIKLVEFSQWHSFRDYVNEGIWHIWAGFDHILFLLTLLLATVATRQPGVSLVANSYRDVLIGVLKMVTAFTLAHSITLSVAAFGFITPPSRVVESLIALSILIAAINNIYPVVTQRLWAVAFGFGLIHGFGFAAVLQELGLPQGMLALSLFGFNLGVEIGQLAIVAVLLPLALSLRRESIYTRVGLSVGSAGIAGIALLWFAERALDLPPFLPSAPSVDLRAELARILPYLGNHLGNPLTLAGIALLGLIGLHWMFGKIEVSVVSAQNSSSSRKMRFARYFLCLALLVISIGTGQTISHAQQEATAMQRAASVTASLTEPLRQQLLVSEPSDPAYQEQVKALSEAIVFLARTGDDAKTNTTDMMEQLAQGQSKPALAILQQLAQQAAAGGQAFEAALILRHRASVATLTDLELAIRIYREATKLDRKSGRTWNLLAYLLQHTRRLGESELAYNKALELGRATQDEAAVALAYERLGATSQSASNPEEAEAKYREALSIYNTHRDKAGLARTYNHLGGLYATQGKFNQAQTMYRDALAIHETLGDRTGVAVDYANLGGVYIAQGSLEQGKRMYHEALRINKALGRKASMALVYSDLGGVAQSRGNWQQAERMFREALRLNEQLGYKPGMASDYTGLGEVYRRVGDLSEAVAVCHKALDLDKHLGNQAGLAVNYTNLGFLYRRQGKTDTAESMYKHALALNKKLNHTAQQAGSYAELGHLYRGRDDLEQAQTMYRASQVLFKKLGSKQKSAEIQSWLDGLDIASLTR